MRHGAKFTPTWVIPPVSPSEGRSSVKITVISAGIVQSWVESDVLASLPRGFALETNCRVGFTLYTTALTQTVNGVVYEVDRNGIHWGIKKLPGKGNYGPNQGTGAHNWYRGRQLQDIGKTEYYLDFQATTGPNISDQYAGTYTANVTITITSLDS